jgi:hypothetical protein
MSKHSSAPTSDASSSALMRARRSSRRRSKRIRSSQSTLIVPYVCSPMSSSYRFRTLATIAPASGMNASSSVGE